MYGYEEDDDYENDEGSDDENDEDEDFVGIYLLNTSLEKLYDCLLAYKNSLKKHFLIM